MAAAADGGGRAPKRGILQYDYLSCSQAGNIQLPANDKRSVHLYGLVLMCTSPRPTAGKDDYVNLRITDNTLAAGAYLDIQIFCRREAAPPLRRAGDIIRLHRVLVQNYKGANQFVLSMSMRPTPSFALFSGDADGSNQPYAHSSPNYSLHQNDLNLLNGLRAHARAHPQLCNLSDQYLCPVSELAPPNDPGQPYRDLHCQVLLVDWPPAGGGAAPVLYVWDGSDARPFPPAMFAHPPGAEALPGLLIARPLPLVEAAEAMPAAAAAARWEGGPAALRAVPPLGSALPVVLAPDAAEALGDPGRLPRAGEWVRLRGLQPVVVRGQLQALYSRTSSWSKAAVAADMVANAKMRYERGHPAMHAGRPMLWGHRTSHACVTRLGERTQALRASSLREALAARAPALLRVCARVTRVTPSDASQLALPRAQLAAGAAAAAAARGDPPPPPQLGPDGREGGYAYALELELTDGTASLTAYLLDEDGAAFFHDVPACAMPPECEAARALEARLGRLICRGGAAEPGGEGCEAAAAEGAEAAKPGFANWAQFALLVHLDARFGSLPDGPDGLDSGAEQGYRRFRIVDTRLHMQ